VSGRNHEESGHRTLGIFAKQPITGQVKTRLAQSTSFEWAQRVAEAFLEDSLVRLRQVSVQRTIAYSPPTAQPHFSRWLSQGYELFPQGEGDLGQRLQWFFRHHRTRGFTHIVVVGSDSPTLPLAYLDEAFQSLDTHDCVIGPAFDGGYYLIGSRSEDFSMLDGIPWSTSAVLERTVQRLRAAGQRFALLPPWYDVDTVEDWAMLRGHVLAMRYAGIDPGVPCIERLISEQPV
jgi:rSAM/selenodomain-associated transferase 1